MRALQIGGEAAGDHLISIENLIGSNYADTLTRDDGVNRILPDRGMKQVKAAARRRRAGRGAVSTP